MFIHLLTNSGIIFSEQISKFLSKNYIMRSIINAVSTAMDLVDPSLVNHHQQVTYIASRLMLELDFESEDTAAILIASILHDVGALSLGSRLKALEFELDRFNRHAELGYHLIKFFKPMTKVANLVRFHHLDWADGEGAGYNGIPVQRGSHLIHLADRIAVLIDRHQPILSQVQYIVEKIDGCRSTRFIPELVDAFKNLAGQEYFWFDSVSPLLGDQVDKAMVEAVITARIDFFEIVELFGHLIDFRSPFTATHSSGVAATASALGHLLGMSRKECQWLQVAGYLHDLGKLAVPVELLDKPGKLTLSEFDMVKSHSFYTYRILEQVSELSTINTWASFHHERLDGRGYPFHLRDGDIPLGARIMAVADVFTALAEDRPYRPGMTKRESCLIISHMVKDNALDGDVVSMLEKNSNDLNRARQVAQTKYQLAYEKFRQN